MRSRQKKGFCWSRQPQDHFRFNMVFYDFKEGSDLELFVSQHTQVRKNDKLATIVEEGNPDSCLSPYSGTICQVLEGATSKKPNARNQLALFVLQRCDHQPAATNQNSCQNCGEEIWSYEDPAEVEFRRRDFKLVDNYSGDLNWSVSLNQVFDKGQKLGMIGDSEVLLDFMGRVTYLGTGFQEEVVFKARRTICKHEKVHEGMCCLCNQFVSAQSQASIVAQANGSILSGRMLQKAQDQTIEQLKQNRKIMLILDLDNTILHCLQTTIAQQVPPTIKDYFLISAGQLLLVVKMRAFLKQFLEAVLPIYQIYIYTKGTRMYAEKICEYIRITYADMFKDGKYREAFTEKRIVSRDEDANLEKKSVDKIISKSQGFIAIMDDRREVWGRPANAVQVKPFKFFFGKSQAGDMIYQKYDDFYLYFATEYMVNLHKRFYQALDEAKAKNQEEPNFGKIVKQARLQCLKGYKAIFMLQGQLKNDRIYRRAIEMGVEPYPLAKQASKSSDNSVTKEQKKKQKQQKKGVNQPQPKSQSNEVSKTQVIETTKIQSSKTELDSLPKPQSNQLTTKLTSSTQGEEASLQRPVNGKKTKKIQANIIICEQKGLKKDYKYYENTLEILMVSPIWIDYCYIYNYAFDPKHFQFKEGGADPYTQPQQQRDLFDQALFQNVKGEGL